MGGGGEGIHAVTFFCCQYPPQWEGHRTCWCAHCLWEEQRRSKFFNCTQEMKKNSANTRIFFFSGRPGGGVGESKVSVQWGCRGIQKFVVGIPPRPPPKWEGQRTCRCAQFVGWGHGGGTVSRKYEFSDIFRHPELKIRK